LTANKAKHLLLAPLDWGMGHTTRCVPLIRHLQAAGHKVTFAGNATQCAFVTKTLPIDTLHLQGYNITYSRKGSTFALHLLTQIPGILKSIRAEHSWLQQQVALHKFDGIISDNRYGLYHSTVPSVIITHQLRIHTGMGNMADNILQKLHYRFLSRFNECWIPDIAGEPNIAGSLSHPHTLPDNTHYIGPLSQLQKPSSAVTTGNTLLILLSGPEPQRTILAGILWQQAINQRRPVVFVEGSAGCAAPTTIPAHITWHAQVHEGQLQLMLQEAAMVICRAGYSTIMDLLLLRKKAILIPTPGQAEQEYLAQHLFETGVFYTAKQRGFNLTSALENTNSFSYVNSIDPADLQRFIPVLDRWSDQL